MPREAEEINFDGLVGPTHHYGGYGYGNIASMAHKSALSYPKQAALQGLNKMKLVAELGIGQAILPPRYRPAFSILRRLGFRGTDRQILEETAKSCPNLFYTLSSSSAMWAANSATISPSADTEDGKVHITIANLASHFHRSIESQEALKLFRLIFPDKSRFCIHPSLPKGGGFGDEGAANHMRFCTHYGSEGVNLFVYSRSLFEPAGSRYPFRQTQEASEAVARLHRLKPGCTLFAKQNPEAIELGVFHNDVIAVGNRETFLYHEKAFVNTDQVIQELEKRIPLKLFCIREEELSIKAAVQSYLFNGQLLSTSEGPLLLLPKECASLNLQSLPFKTQIVDLTQSMQNGGGPACLRLRCVLTEREKALVLPSLFLTSALYQRLVDWVDRHFRDELRIEELADPSLLLETQEALDELTQILSLGSFYHFQK